MGKSANVTTRVDVCNRERKYQRIFLLIQYFIFNVTLSFQETALYDEIQDLDLPDYTLLSVAIDFGTTYSGYAFSTRGDFQTDPTKMYANEDWPAGTKGFSKKTPTVLLLNPDKEFEAFGYEAEEIYNHLAAENEHKDWYYFRRFKMKLHGEQVCNTSPQVHLERGVIFAYFSTLPSLPTFHQRECKIHMI